MSTKKMLAKPRAVRDRLYASESLEEIQWYLEGCIDLPSPTLDPVVLRKKALKRWMLNRLDIIDKVGLACPGNEDNTDIYRGWSTQIKLDLSTYTYSSEEYNGTKTNYPVHLFPKSLESIGVDTPAKGNRFLDLYLQVYDSGRSWVSGCQVNHDRVAQIALTPNYNRLPLWVKKGLLNAPYHARIGGDRIGNIWRLIPCVKAWKWTPNLPKRIAEKLGKCSPRLRMLAAWAWNNVDYYASPGAKISQFYEALSFLDRASLGEQLSWMLGSNSPGWGRERWAAFLEVAIGLPHGVIDLPKDVDMVSIEKVIMEFSTPAEACKLLFGCSGKATVKAFQSSGKHQRDWAKAIGDANPDAVQKILGIKDSIAFQPEAVEFLKSLPMTSRLRLLEAKTFRYRGIEHPISDDHVRDTGYLWKNINVRPCLGRVRCWFSVHEALAAAFVKELPDEALPVPQGWTAVDGLCAVDGSWEIEIPKRVATLKYYGEVLHNCVGGYGPAIKSGRSVIFVVREHGQITHCGEVEKLSLRQFYRSGNSYPDEGIKKAISISLENAKLIGGV